jgi:ribosomal protein S18 acetylase RimI-like enzyme
LSLRDALGNLAATHRRHGVGAAALFAWSTLNRDTRHYYLFGLSHPHVLPEPTVSTEGHCFRLATDQDVSASNGVWTPRDVDAIRRGDRCLMHWDGDRLAGYTWAAGGSLVYLIHGVHLNLPDDAAYIYKAYTAPEYRGRGFQGQRTLELLRLLQADGRRRLFAYAERENFDSRKGMRKAGYEQVGSMTIARRRGEIRVILRISNAFWSDVRRA